jgi:toxin-antitoxin system PIN domain toxin
VTFIDVNVLLYADNRSSEHHALAKAFIDSEFSSDEATGFSWLTLLAFTRLAINPRVYANPISTARATSIVDEWLSLPHTVVVAPGPRHWSILKDSLSRAQVGAALVSDAHLAALAIEHDAKLVSADRDFTRFPKLRFTHLLEVRL